MSSSTSSTSSSSALIEFQGFSSYSSIITLVELIFQMLFMVPGLYLFYKRRYLFPIASRDGGGFSFNYNPSNNEYGCMYTFTFGCLIFFFGSGLLLVLLLWPVTDDAIWRLVIFWMGAQSCLMM